LIRTRVDQFPFGHISAAADLPRNQEPKRNLNAVAAVPDALLAFPHKTIFWPDLIAPTME
jgi:hypothetical protein